MKARCKPGSPCSRYYSDRGIAVCPEWERSYEAFRDWAIGAGYADHLELDRIDNDRGYAPDNCRWATRTQQMRNTGKRRNAKTSRYKGVSWCANARKWRAQLGGDRGVSHIGYFADEVAAARAYDEAAIAAFGDFANTNFSERGRDAEPA